MNEDRKIHKEDMCCDDVRIAIMNETIKTNKKTLDAILDEMKEMKKVFATKDEIDFIKKLIYFVIFGFGAQFISHISNLVMVNG